MNIAGHGQTAQFTSQLGLLGRFVHQVFPKVEDELNRWRLLSQACPDRVLADQAAASIGSKRFHAQGGSVYALYPGVSQTNFTGFVVALQTISDYLDNLCDRAGIEDEAGFRQLHLAMSDALSPETPMADYYGHYPHRGDGGYLASLVNECRKQVSTLPSYHLVQDEVLKLARLYSELQTYKHLPLAVRERRMLEWIRPYRKTFSDISCWEFAAATGSTLGMFVLCAAAASPNLTGQQVEQLKQAYFPWICGLHILLDYFIDQEEDRVGGDLNFVFYYRDSNECEKRLNWFLKNALRGIAGLENPLFHRTVLEGLLAMYLSDPKTANSEVRTISKNLVRTGGPTTRLMYNICRLLRWRRLL